MDKSVDTATSLLNSTVKVISREGLDKASIRTISADCHIPNPYIYQHFKNKDALLAYAFKREDVALAAVLERSLKEARQVHPAVDSRCHVLWNKMWKYLMEYPDNIRFYVQYYYSIYYLKYSKESHIKLFQPIAERMAVCFKPDTQSYALLQYMLDTMMNMAMKVYIGELPDTPKSRERYFGLILHAISSYTHGKCSGSQPDCFQRMGRPKRAAQLE